MIKNDVVVDTTDLIPLLMPVMALCKTHVEQVALYETLLKNAYVLAKTTRQCLRLDNLRLATVVIMNQYRVEHDDIMTISKISNALLNTCNWMLEKTSAPYGKPMDHEKPLISFNVDIRYAVIPQNCENRPEGCCQLKDLQVMEYKISRIVGTTLVIFSVTNGTMEGWM